MLKVRRRKTLKKILIIVSVLLITFICFILIAPKLGFSSKFYYQNKSYPCRKKNLLDLLVWKFSHQPKRSVQQIPFTREEVNLPKTINQNEVYVTFINHATELIQLNGLSVLTDPVFSERVGPFGLVGPKRLGPPALNIDQLPNIDIVLISHNHYDHLDLDSIKILAQSDNTLFIVPIGNGSLLKNVGVKSVIELDWWQSYEINHKIKIVLTPAQHWSGRGLFDHCIALWGGYLIINKDVKVFFAGDTGYGKHFNDIVEKHGPMDISILPIGAYEPRWFMKDFHIDPKEALQAHLDLKSKLSIGMHYGTFLLGDEDATEPIYEIKKYLSEFKIDVNAFLTPNIGQTIFYKKGN